MSSEINNNYENEIIEKDDNRSKLLDGVLDWAESFIFAIFVVVLVFTFLMRTVVVVGSSMYPTFEDGDRLIITHFFDTPKNGDVLVMNSQGLNETIIKRCIGIEGDTVRVDYNTQKVTVNGKEIKNDYINEPMEDLMGEFSPEYVVEQGVYEYKVPEGKVFVMGDNRNHSTDSRCMKDQMNTRYVGFVDVDDILGKVVLRLYPFDKIGSIKNRL